MAEDVAAEATVTADLRASSPPSYRAAECLLTAEEAVAQAAAEGLQLPRSLGESETGFLGV